MSNTISFCTVVHKRLDQFKKTLENNHKFLRVDSIDLVVLAYNDLNVKPFLEENYAEYITDGRIKVFEVNDNYQPLDRSNFACGYVKHIVHQLADYKVLFNLDADNFITRSLVSELKKLPPRVFLTPLPDMKNSDGSWGRIGMHKTAYDLVGGYRDKGRADDTDIIERLICSRFKMIFEKKWKRPLPNDYKEKV